MQCVMASWSPAFDRREAAIQASPSSRVKSKPCPARSASRFRYWSCVLPLPSQNAWTWLTSPRTGPTPSAKASGLVP